MSSNMIVPVLISNFKLFYGLKYVIEKKDKPI